MKNLRLYSSHQDIDGIKIGNTVIAFEDGSKPIYMPITPIESNGVVNWDMFGDNRFVFKKADGTIIYCNDTEELRNIDDADSIAGTLYVNIKPTNGNVWGSCDVKVGEVAMYFGAVKFYPYTYPYNLYQNDTDSYHTTKIYLYGMDGDDEFRDIVSSMGLLGGGTAEVYYNNVFYATLDVRDPYAY